MQRREIKRSLIQAFDSYSSYIFQNTSYCFEYLLHFMIHVYIHLHFVLSILYICTACVHCFPKYPGGSNSRTNPFNILFKIGITFPLYLKAEIHRSLHNHIKKLYRQDFECLLEKQYMFPYLLNSSSGPDFSVFLLILSCC